MERIDLPPTREEILERALERIAARGCRMSFTNRPRGTTCLDQQAEARESEDRHDPEFRDKVLDLGYPCAACQAAAALKVRV